MIRPLAVLALLVVAHPAVADDTDSETVYDLPAGAKSPVIELDYKGGFTPPRRKQDPLMSILADGTVLLPDRFGNSKDVTGRITPAEIQDLLRFILEEKGFAKVDGGAIKKEVAEAQRKKGGFAPVVADAPDTWVRVSIKGSTHEARYYALGMAAGQYPEVGSLQDFDAVAKRLMRTMNVVKGGGREAVAAMLKLANAELKKQHPDAAPLTMEHFTSAGTRADGTTYHSFSRRSANFQKYVNASVQTTTKGETTVTIRAKL